MAGRPPSTQEERDQHDEADRVLDSQDRVTLGRLVERIGALKEQTTRQDGVLKTISDVLGKLDGKLDKFTERLAVLETTVAGHTKHFDDEKVANRDGKAYALAIIGIIVGAVATLIAAYARMRP